MSNMPVTSRNYFPVWCGPCGPRVASADDSLFINMIGAVVLNCNIPIYHIAFIVLALQEYDSNNLLSTVPTPFRS